jgi:signal transduction histidine kinase
MQWVPFRLASGQITGAIAAGFDTTERIQAEREALRARAAAEQLMMMQNAFLAATSHELRTPLTAILGYAELLEHRWALMDENERRQRIARIVLAANRQLHLVEDLLLASSLSNGSIPVLACPVLFAPLVWQATSEVLAAATDQCIDVEGPQDLQIVADPYRVVQVLVNLVDNAMKYSPAGGRISVTWESEMGVAAIRVRDQGPGLPVAGRERLFTRFGRLPGSIIRSGRTGTGLGLFIGRTLARAMDGDLDVESTGPNGTVFKLVLPLSPDLGNAA